MEQPAAASTEMPPSPGSVGLRRYVLRGVLVVGLFAVVVLVIQELVPGAGKRLADADPGWLVAAVAIELAALASYVVLFHGVFSRPPYLLRRRRSAEIAVGELAGFTLVPAGAGGPVVRFWALRMGDMPWHTIGARSVSYGVLFNLPYVLGALGAGLGVVFHVSGGRAPTAVALAPLGIVLGGGVLIVVLIALSRRGWPKGTKRWRRRLRAILAVFPEGIRGLPYFRKHPAAPLGAFGWWIGDCAVLWAALHACGGSPPVAVVILAYMLGQLGNALPLPGGIGGVEPLMLGILVASGVDAGIGAAGVVCYRAIAIGLQSLLGVAAVTSLVPAARAEHAARQLAAD
jgi:putative heme transporter